MTTALSKQRQEASASTRTITTWVLDAVRAAKAVSRGWLATGVLFASVWSSLASTAWAQGTYTAASCSQSDVNAVINGPAHIAVDGDVIRIPPGSCTWTSGIAVPIGVGISIIGSGMPVSGASTMGASSSCGATAITDNITSGDSLILLQPTFGSSISRVSCMKILGQSGLGPNSITSPVAIQGACNSIACPNVRVDNVTFDGSLQGIISNSSTVMVTDNVFGVLDHNSASGVGTQGIEFVNFNNSAWDGVGAFGDNSWTSANTFGTDRVLYMENNAFGAGIVMGETESAVPNGGEGGGRIVARFNSCNGCLGGVSAHGTESNGRPRGGRQIEFYGNTFICTDTSAGCQGAVATRSAVVYLFGNSLTVGPGSWFDQYLGLAVYRVLQEFPPWGGCDGTGPYDDNDGVVYASGVMTSVSTNVYTITITDTSKSWAMDQWHPKGAPYAIRDLTTNSGAEIVGSGSNTASASGWTGPPNFHAGDAYQILRAAACIDQPSRSGGALLSGWQPIPTGPVHQMLDPSYEWNDSGYNPVFGNATDTSGNDRMIANRDWYTDDSNGIPRAQTSPTSPFSGTSGMGFGTLANRPSSCNPSVGYWATDQGNWNASGNGFGQGQLFVCTAPNTWTLHYTPYTYPHPLAAASVTISPPTNLRAVVH
jgi:hypothetical protein